jgi:hypothetical protein
MIYEFFYSCPEGEVESALVDGVASGDGITLTREPAPEEGCIALRVELPHNFRTEIEGIDAYENPYAGWDEEFICWADIPAECVEVWQESL